MTEILLHEFFRALRAERLPVGIRDIGRLRTLFSTQRDWTLSAIQDSLRALLAHEPGQRATFDRVFRMFFVDSRVGEPVESIDLARALKDLQEVPRTSPERRQIPTPPSPDKPELPQKPGPKIPPPWLHRHWKAAGSALIALILLVSAGVWLWPPSDSSPEIAASTLQLEPATLNFGAVPVTTRVEKQLTLTNTSATQSAKITSLDIAGDFRDFEKIGWDALQDRLLTPGEKVTLTVSFTPQKADDLRGAVVINAVSDWPPVQTAMQGIGTKSETVAAADTPRPPEVVEPIFTVAGGETNSIRHELIPLIHSRDWQYWLAASAVCFALLALLSVYVYRWRQPPQELPPVSRENEDHERFFFASVGGLPAPLLKARQAKRLGDTLDFVRTDMLSSRLDAPASVAATIRAGGIPRLQFQPLVTLRTVVVLEDGWTHSNFRSAIIDQLCDELQDTGVTFTRYQFRGSAETLTGDRGQTLDLGELARARDTQAVLLFTDGSSFANPRGQESLERLAEWPRIAWMELREASRRAAHGPAARESSMPVFPATSVGLQAAFDQFAVPGHQISNFKFQISNLRQSRVSRLRTSKPTSKRRSNPLCCGQPTASLYSHAVWDWQTHCDVSSTPTFQPKASSGFTR